MMNTSSTIVQPTAASPSRKISKPRMRFVQAIIDHYTMGGITLPADGAFSRQTLLAISSSALGKSWIPNWITHDKSRKAGRGYYFIPEITQIAGAN